MITRWLQRRNRIVALAMVSVIAGALLEATNDLLFWEPFSPVTMALAIVGF